MDSLFFLALLAAGPLTGYFFYRFYYRIYRNAEARYRFEHTTNAVIQNVLHHDEHATTVRRSRSPSIKGRNDNTPAKRAQYVRVHRHDVAAGGQPPQS